MEIEIISILLRQNEYSFHLAAYYEPPQCAGGRYSHPFSKRLIPLPQVRLDVAPAPGRRRDLGLSSVWG